MKYELLLLGIAFIACGCDRKPPPGARTQSTAAVVSASASAPAPKPSRAAAMASSRRVPAPDAPAASIHPVKFNPGSGEARQVTWSFDDTKVGEMKVVVVIPDNATEAQKLPVLITMHGQGEALKGPAKGARGWVDDYWLPKALRRLHAPPLNEKDFRRRVDPQRLQSFNDELSREPYKGVIVVCPYTPYRVLKGPRAFKDGKLLADFLVDVLIPKVYAQTPAIGTPETTGIDGVSLGGRASVLVGLERPNAFGVLGALQPAFDVEDAEELAKRAKVAREKNPDLKIRLLTSDGDFYLASTKAISRAMKEAGVDNTLDVVPGDHSYDFNRGPGVYEMLLLHDRALRR